MKDNVDRLRTAHLLAKSSRERKQAIWRAASRKLGGNRQNRALVNVGEISRNTKEGAKVIVPGKVLGGGELDHKVTVGAYTFSEGARAKIYEAGGKCFTLLDFVVDNKNSKNVMILG
jgi:large subunit ribosomal protein L18e